MTKVWWQSKTIWLNLILGAASLFSAIFPTASVVTTWINANMALIGTVWSGLAIALRFISKGAVTLGE